MIAIILSFEKKIMKLLIVYGTTEGQTRKIARYMEDVLQDAGHKVTIADASDEPPSPENYDAILIGASIYIHKYQSAVTHYINHHVAALNKMPGAFFSVCLAVASDMEEEHREAQRIANDFLDQTKWKPLMVTHIAGALKYTKYDFFKRLLMKMIAKREGRTTDTSQDYEYTNWIAVKKFVNEFADKAFQSDEIQTAIPAE
jgi:menaquinone-dependent protoporphyrinogen oxidase